MRWLGASSGRALLRQYEAKESRRTTQIGGLAVDKQTGCAGLMQPVLSDKHACVEHQSGS